MTAFYLLGFLAVLLVAMLCVLIGIGVSFWARAELRRLVDVKLETPPAVITAPAPEAAAMKRHDDDIIARGADVLRARARERGVTLTPEAAAAEARALLHRVDFPEAPGG